MAPKQPAQPRQPRQPRQRVPPGAAAPAGPAAAPVTRASASPAAAGERQPWDQQPGEPDRWYGRFTLYLQLGPVRTYHMAFQQNAQAHNRTVGSSIPSNWLQWARIWHWRERAQAWDAHQRDLLALSERNLRRGLHQRRVDMMEDMLEEVRAALVAADIGGADQALAREWMPQLRVFLRDLLVAERQEFERDFTGDDPAAGAAITADDLRAAQRELAQRELEERELGQQERGQVPLGQVPLGQAGDSRGGQGPGAEGAVREGPICNAYPLLVCTGPDPDLLLDLAALRAVRAATGLKFSRVLNATRRKLSRALSRQRDLGRPVEYMHMAVHASGAGLELADGPVDGNWLSERLEGVRVVLLASCESDGIGDWLGVVPYVITLSEEIPNEEAAALARHFWEGIGSGLEAGAALDRALAHCAPVVGEYVVRHW